MREPLAMIAVTAAVTVTVSACSAPSVAVPRARATPASAASGNPPGRFRRCPAQALEELQQTLDLHSGRLDRIEDNQRRMQDSQRQLQDSQRQQFEHLSAQVAEILSVLRGPAPADPTPVSEQ